MHRWLAAAFHGVIAAGVLTGCSILKARPAPDSGFLAEPERMAANRARAPFHRMWLHPDFAAVNYGSILVAPVNTEYVLEQSTWAKTNPRNIMIEDDLAEIAIDFRQRVMDRFRAAKQNRFAIVDGVRDDSVILELAITQLVPGRPFFGAIGLASWAAPLPIGVPAGAIASFADDGWMAIEGRVREAKSGRVIAMFADREASKTRIVDVEAITWYGHARESMNDWADQFVLLANTPWEIQVEDSSAFTLLPW